MSERITVDNLDEVVRKNIEIRGDMMQKAILVRTNWNSMQITSVTKLAMYILRMYGLIQMPIDNQSWSGAIYVISGKKIPIINTAQPRVNQYFTAWSEIYHLIFDQILMGRIMESETVMEDRKAQYFASIMLLGNVYHYYSMLTNMDFTTKVLHCMDTFSAPYKAVLISLYEAGVQSHNSELCTMAAKSFDENIYNIEARFNDTGLDTEILKPSNVINVTALSSKIQDCIKRDPDIKYNHENLSTLNDIVKELQVYIDKS